MSENLLESAKQFIKELEGQKPKNPMDTLLKNKEVIATARFLEKKMSKTKARVALNSLLKEKGMLPKVNDTEKQISTVNFNKLLPKQRKKKV